jgi:hypothetical protein
VPFSRRGWLVRALSCSSLGSAVKLRADPRSQDTIRSNFPIVRERTFLNNANWHPLSFGAREAIQAYLQRKAAGSTRFSFLPARDKAKAHFAKLINSSTNSWRHPLPHFGGSIFD